MLRIPFAGHPNIRSTHPTTIEVTTQNSLTPRGDCIIGVGADFGCAGLPPYIKESLQDGTSRVRITIRVDSQEFAMTGRGDPRLALSHPEDMVIRKSDFACPRTLAVGCSAASCDIPRPMVRRLQYGAGGIMLLDIERFYTNRHTP